MNLFARREHERRRVAPKGCTLGLKRAQGSYGRKPERSPKK